MGIMKVMELYFFIKGNMKIEIITSREFKNYVNWEFRNDDTMRKKCKNLKVIKLRKCPYGYKYRVFLDDK